MSKISDLDLHPATDWRVIYEIESLQKSVENNWRWAEQVDNPELIDKFLDQGIKAQERLDMLVRHYRNC